MAKPVSHMRANGFLDEDEEGRELGKKPRTLKLWRKLKKGPAYTTDAGGHVWYRHEWNVEYLESRKVVPTRDERRQRRGR